MRRLLSAKLVLAAAPLLATIASASTYTDNFESYAPGTFPAANWIDSATIAPFSNLPPPNPSCTVGVTTNAFGQSTRALHLDGSWVGSASGIYRAVDTQSNYTLSMDVRTDAFGGGATDNPSDWPWMLGVSKFDATEQAGGWHSLMIYGTDMSHDFRGYSIENSGEEDFPLGMSIAAATWYHVQIDVDAVAGSIRNRIWNGTATTLLLDQIVTAAGWTPADGVFDVVTINQGELSATTSSDVWVDNVNVNATPEPATLALLALGAIAGFRRRR